MVLMGRHLLLLSNAAIDAEVILIISRRQILNNDNGVCDCVNVTQRINVIK